MNIALSIIAILVGWRFLVCLAVAIALAFPLGHLLGPIVGFSIALFGIGFGCIWQGRWLTGIPLFASVPSPPISKSVAFLGLAFIGAIVGGFASEVFGSPINGTFALIAAVALVGTWRRLVLKRHIALNSLVLSCISLLSGLGILYALTLLRT